MEVTPRWTRPARRRTGSGCWRSGPVRRPARRSRRSCVPPLPRRCGPSCWRPTPRRCAGRRRAGPAGRPPRPGRSSRSSAARRIAVSLHAARATSPARVACAPHRRPGAPPRRARHADVGRRGRLRHTGAGTARDTTVVPRGGTLGTSGAAYCSCARSSRVRALHARSGSPRRAGRGWSPPRSGGPAAACPAVRTGAHADTASACSAAQLAAGSATSSMPCRRKPSIASARGQGAVDQRVGCRARRRRSRPGPCASRRAASSRRRTVASARCSGLVIGVDAAGDRLEHVDAREVARRGQPRGRAPRGRRGSTGRRRRSGRSCRRPRPAPCRGR